MGNPKFGSVHQQVNPKLSGPPGRKCVLVYRLKDDVTDFGSIVRLNRKRLGLRGDQTKEGQTVEGNCAT
jgi:hypothetical protein